MENTYDNRKFIIFNVSELNLINFDEVLETSIDSVRISIDGTKTFVKWDGKTPVSVLNLQTSEGFHTYEEMSNILSTSEWTINELVEWVK